MYSHALIRNLGILTFISNIASSAISVVLLFRLNTELGLPSQISSLIMTEFSIGAIISFLITTFMLRKKLKNILLIILYLQSFPPFLIMLTDEPSIIILLITILGGVGVIWNIYSLTLR